MCVVVMLATRQVAFKCTLSLIWRHCVQLMCLSMMADDVDYSYDYYYDYDYAGPYDEDNEYKIGKNKKQKITN